MYRQMQMILNLPPGTCMVNQVITNHLLMTKHLFKFSSYVLHFEWFKMLSECCLKLSKALEIIFEVQRKRSNGKIIRKQISFSTYKMYFFFPFSLEPSYFQIS
jgi:hypothetical protein